MSGEIDVDLGDLQTHAGDLQAVAAKISGAQSAGTTVTSLSPHAFGILCSFFTPPCLLMSAGALEGMDTLKGTVEGYARTVPAVGEIIRAADERVGTTMDKVRSQLA